MIDHSSVVVDVVNACMCVCTKIRRTLVLVLLFSMIEKQNSFARIKKFILKKKIISKYIFKTLEYDIHIKYQTNKFYIIRMYIHNVLGVIFVSAFVFFFFFNSF